MDEEAKRLLEENLRLSKENNELLLKIRSVQRWSQISKIIYWVIILGITYGAFYYLKPYLEGVMNIYSGGVSGGTTNVNDLKELLKVLNS